MSADRVRLVLHRLYLTLFWPLSLLAIGWPGYAAVVRIHDTFVVRRDFACYARMAGPDLSPACVTDGHTCFSPDAYLNDAAAKCNLFSYGGTLQGHLYSSRAWKFDSPRDVAPSVTGEIRDLLPLIVLSCSPLVLLVALRTWLRWMAKPPKEGA